MELTQQEFNWMAEQQNVELESEVALKLQEQAQ